MENAFRAILIGVIFHFAAGLITASLWRLVHRKEAKSQNYNNPNSVFWDIFSEVMIWPLYLTLLFFSFIRFLADLIICAINKMKKRRIMMGKEKPKTQKNTGSIYDEIFKEEHMLSGEAEASYLMRHPELTKKNPRAETHKY